MTADDTDNHTVWENITKAQACWGQLCQLLTHQGALQQVMGLFYKAMVQVALLYDAETWLLTQPLLC